MPKVSRSHPSGLTTPVALGSIDTTRQRRPPCPAPPHAATALAVVAVGLLGACSSPSHTADAITTTTQAPPPLTVVAPTDTTAAVATAPTKAASTTTTSGASPTTVTTRPPATTTTRGVTTSTTARPPTTSFNASGVPVGYYQCYRSIASSGSSTGYDTTSPGSFTLSSDGSYSQSLKGATGHWTSADNAISFVGGGFDDTTGERDHGVYVPGGAVLPHNQINDGAVLTIVIQGSPTNNDAATAGQRDRRPRNLLVLQAAAVIGFAPTARR